MHFKAFEPKLSLFIDPKKMHFGCFSYLSQLARLLDNMTKLVLIELIYFVYY